MTKLSQDEFNKAKTALDRAIKIVDRIAAQAADMESSAMVSCCRSDSLDQRDQFAMLGGKLRGAHGLLLEARSIGGGVSVPDVITRGGST